MHILRIALVAGMVVTALAVIHEVARRTGISRRQRILRICSGVAMIVLLGLILVGNVFGILFASTEEMLTKPKLLTLAYGFACLGIGLLLVVFALVDILETLRTWRRKMSEMRGEFHKRDGLN